MKKIITAVLALVLILYICPASFAAGSYSAIVTDQNARPVVGAKVQLCDDSACYVQETDSEGAVYFEGLPKGKYDIKILSLPEGYENNAEPQTTGDSGYEQRYFTVKTAGDYPVPQSVYGSLDEIDFSGYKLIMVNYWEPWCSWCIKEMPDLEKLYQEYKGDGLLIVGMYSTKQDADKVMEETGITYPTVYYEGRVDAVENGYPATQFFDSGYNLLAPEAEELSAYYVNAIGKQIREYYNGEYAEYTDEESLEYFELLEQFNKDESMFKEYCAGLAQQDMDICRGAFVGYGDYDVWNARIMRRLSGEDGK